MSSEVMIRVEGLGKRYVIGARRAQYETLRDKLVEVITAPFRRRDQQEQRAVWALQDVSFTVAPGEVLGVIGRNGAGKSTLLKILTRVIEPTRGRVELFGHVGSLLEVGTGFHGELTGRENIFLNGAILGMKRREIEDRFDEIVSFAEIGQFLDTPVKRYSSGMYMRLAFAVAAHMDPEILLVDEVLAVGDTAFQQKSLRKLRNVSGEGRTVLFVSHNFEAINALCTRCLLLHEGRILFDGDPTTAIQLAMEQFRAAGNESFHLQVIRKDRGVPQPEMISVRAEGKSPNDTITFEDEIIATVRLDGPIHEDHTFAFQALTMAGVTIFSSFYRDDPKNPPLLPGQTTEARIRIPKSLLPGGVYEAMFFYMLPNADLFWVAREIVFEVQDVTSSRNAGLTAKRGGVVSMVLPWEAN